MEYSLDIGQNLTLLGLIFLGLKYLLPVFIGAAILYTAYWILKNKYPTLETDEETLLGIFAIILVIFLITR